MRLPRQRSMPAPGFTIHYEQPQAASGWSDAQTSTTQQAARSDGLRFNQNVVMPLLLRSLLGVGKKWPRKMQHYVALVIFYLFIKCHLSE